MNKQMFIVIQKYMTHYLQNQLLRQQCLDFCTERQAQRARVCGQNGVAISDTFYAVDSARCRPFSASKMSITARLTIGLPMITSCRPYLKTYSETTPCSVCH